MTIIIKHEPISIQGSKRFGEHTVAALDLIKSRDRRNYNKIGKYLKIIKQSRQSGMVLSKAQFNVANKSAFYSPEWYASIIIHDLHHYYLHHVKNFHWKPKNFLKHEHLCIDEQLKFLKKIKAPKHVIKHLNGAYKRGHWRSSYQKTRKSW